MEYAFDDERVEKFVKYGVNVWRISKDKNKYDIANEAINKTRESFVSLGLPRTLRGYELEKKI